jgi:hypothetical protein
MADHSRFILNTLQNKNVNNAIKYITDNDIKIGDIRESSKEGMSRYITYYGDIDQIKYFLDFGMPLSASLAFHGLVMYLYNPPIIDFNKSLVGNNLVRSMLFLMTQGAPAVENNVNVTWYLTNEKFRPKLLEILDEIDSHVPLSSPQAKPMRDYLKTLGFDVFIHRRAAALQAWRAKHPNAAGGRRRKTRRRKTRRRASRSHK